MIQEFKYTKPILQDDEVQSALSILHDKFVIVPIDKATNNVAVICKRFYVQKLLNEVGIPGDSPSTYKLSDRSPSDVIDNNATLCEKFGLSLEERQKSLPFMFGCPRCIILHLDLGL